MASQTVGITPTTVLIDAKTGTPTRDGFLVFQAILAFFQGTQSSSVTTDGVQTLTNKTISGSANTLSNIPTSALVNTSGNGPKVVTTNAVGTGGDFAIWDASGNISDGSPQSILGTFLAATPQVANGTVAVTVTSLGPTGAQTTIQGWLTFNDSGAVARYVPYF